MTTLPWKRNPNAWIAGAGVLLCAGLIALIVVLTSGSSDPYRVRAIFDNAANLTQGEQVKVAGVPVGSVESVTPTPEAKAAVVMSISNAGFQDFRTDAYCIIRPQSLLGEKFVDCRPTEAHAEGAEPPPALKVIPEGQEGAGERLLPVQNTASPVDPDLLTDINQLPYAERLRIILNELGVGLAGRGEDLHEVIVRANPALRETNRVLAILANENRVLSKLAVDSDRALAPLAVVRKRVADSFAQQNAVATASARHETALARNLALFPPFLEQLGPVMERIRAFADETIPTFTELGKAAPALNRIFTQLPAFSSSSTVYFKSLGKFGKTAGPALKATEPLLERLEVLGTSAQPFANNLSSLLSSLKSTGGIERFMDFIFLAAGATNGYNSLGHFLRADLLSTNCVTYRATFNSGCGANFLGSGSSSASTSSAAARASSILQSLPGASGEGEAQDEGGSQGAGSTHGGSEVGASLEHVLAFVNGRKHPSSGSHASALLLNYLLGE